MTRAECYIVSVGRTSGHGMDMGGKGRDNGNYFVISFLCSQVPRNKKNLWKKSRKKVFPYKCVYEAAPPHRSEDRFPRQQDLGRFLSQTLNTHCMTLVKWGTPAFLNLLLLLSSVFKIACDCTHFGNAGK